MALAVAICWRHPIIIRYCTLLLWHFVSVFVFLRRHDDLQAHFHTLFGQMVWHDLFDVPLSLIYNNKNHSNNSQIGIRWRTIDFVKTKQTKKKTSKRNLFICIRRNLTCVPYDCYCYGVVPETDWICRSCLQWVTELSVMQTDIFCMYSNQYHDNWCRMV